MVQRNAFVLAVACMFFPVLPGTAAELAAELEDGRVAVTIDGALFTCYKFADDQKTPYLWPVIGPASGESVTVESTEPYPHHHSIFFGCDRVNGGNYWQDVNARGQILSQGPKIVETGGERVVIEDTCLWKRPGKPAVIRDERRIAVCAPADGERWIDFTITLHPLEDVTIEKTNHSLFSARMMPELSVKGGGTLVNAEGKTSEKGTWGAASPWCDYYGTRGGVTEGLAILQHPGNPWYPSKWFTRDYGFFSPTPMYWPEGDSTQLPKGEPVTLKYRVIVHEGDTASAGIAARFQAFAG